MNATGIIRGTRGRGMVLAIGLAFVAGCGEHTGPPRLPISGQVTLDGQPLSTGAITLLPDGPGLAVGGTIAAGSFSLRRSEGPAPGTYRVEITSVQPTGRQVKSPDDPTATIDEVGNLIPTRYNLKSQLKVEVKIDGDNAFRFDLTSHEDPVRGRRVVASGSGAADRSRRRERR